MCRGAGEATKGKEIALVQGGMVSAYTQPCIEIKACQGSC
jgi:hypothetical protein